MTVGATGSSTATTGTQDQTTLGRTQLTQSFDTFLSLLTTQLKNQDPLSPMDSTQFTQQLVQMTGVEQQLATNDLLKQLVANSNTSVSSAVGLIGKEVNADTADAQLANGKAVWTYTLPSDASDVKIEVLDSKGLPVKTAAAPAASNTAGQHTYTWDGVNDFGDKLNDGTYSLRITAKDKDGKTIDATTKVEGKVTAIESLDGQTVITVNGLKIPLSQINSVTDPATADTGADGSSNNNNTSGGDSTGGSTNPDDQTSSAAA